MNFGSDSLGESIAKRDLIIKKTIQHIIEKEQKILEQYKRLNSFKPHCSKSMKNKLDTLLEERRLFLAYKMQSKEQQCKALFKLLEYLNTLESKDKKLQSQIILAKIKHIEVELKPLRELFN
tara:strand:- start:2485 stop:2850 length:366 start_codon:yes stop_codon:yes gene_type:complete